MTRQPCPSCPWRIDQHADEIPNFKLDLAEELVRTTDDQFGAPIFACHQSQQEKEVVCVGWLWRYGWDSIAIRLKLAREAMRPEELEMPPDWDDRLHRTFDEVITKLRRDTIEDGRNGAQ
jgi:hypothetical protein